MTPLLLILAMQVGAPPRMPTPDEGWPPGLHAEATAVEYLWLDAATEWRYGAPVAVDKHILVAGDCDLTTGHWYAGVQAGNGVLEFADPGRMFRVCRIPLPADHPGLQMVVRFLAPSCPGDNPGPCRSQRMRPYLGSLELGTPLAPESVEVR